MKRLALALALAGALPACADQTAKTTETAMSEWVLHTIDGKAPGWRATIYVSEPGKIAGRAPCNQYFAGLVTDGAGFAVKPIAASRMACADLAGEAVYFEVLQQMTAMDQTAQQLVLTGKGHEMVFVLAE
jgi:heat shock protein HslJ